MENVHLRTYTVVPRKSLSLTTAITNRSPPEVKPTLTNRIPKNLVNKMWFLARCTAQKYRFTNRGPQNIAKTSSKPWLTNRGPPVPTKNILTNRIVCAS